MNHNDNIYGQGKRYYNGPGDSLGDPSVIGNHESSHDPAPTPYHGNSSDHESGHSSGTPHDTSSGTHTGGALGNVLTGVGGIFAGLAELKNSQTQSNQSSFANAMALYNQKNQQQKLSTPAIIGIVGGSVVVLGIIVYAITR